MEIYVLRHGIAVPRGTRGFPNDDRPLTPEGVDAMTRAASGIVRVMEPPDIMITSPLQRARATADIVADRFSPHPPIEIGENLLPGKPISDVFDWMSNQAGTRRVLLVGHEPDLGFLVSSLLGSESSIVHLRKGGLCRVDVTSMPPRQPGVLMWSLPPEFLVQIGKI